METKEFLYESSLWPTPQNKASISMWVNAATLLFSETDRFKNSQCTVDVTLKAMPGIK